MDQGPLVREQIDAGANFLDEFGKFVPVQLAFWSKNDDGQWNLYVASDQINDARIRERYRDVLRVAKEIMDPYFDPFKVKLVGMDDDEVSGVERLPKGRLLDGVYIYPTMKSLSI